MVVGKALGVDAVFCVPGNTSEVPWTSAGQVGVDD